MTRTRPSICFPSVHRIPAGRQPALRLAVSTCLRSNHLGHWPESCPNCQLEMSIIERGECPFLTCHHPTWKTVSRGSTTPPVGRWGDAVGSRPCHYLYTAEINCVASIRSSACMAWNPSSPQKHSGHEQVASGPGCGVRSCLPHVGIEPAINPGYLPPHTTNSLLVATLHATLIPIVRGAGVEHINRPHSPPPGPHRLG
jgi:hypothetical protein